MIRLRRLLSTVLLSLLLAGTQLASRVHALEHVREALKQTPDHSLTVPGTEICAMCALFAGSASAATGDIDHAYPCCTTEEATQSLPASFAPAPRLYYHSRAPPSLL
jgi:hypothetical protein